MIKAGALFVAVTISFVIAVLISLLITLAFHYKIQNRENLLQKKLERNANSAIRLLMTDSDFKEGERIIDLYGESNDSVYIKKYSWGVYDVASVRAFSGRYQLTKTVEYGYKPDETIAAAIYLSDLNIPLSVCGKTKITGNCYLPERSTRRGSVNGRNFEGNDFIDGITLRSKNSLPPLDKEIVKRLTDVFSKNTFQAGFYKEVILTDSLVNSFLDSTILVRLDSGSDLAGKYLSGNIIIYSSQTITIDATSRLDDVLIFAKAIKVNRNFNGNMQAFATDSIIVEENCTLKYPSALGIFKIENKSHVPYIRLMKNSELTGMVFSYISEFVSDQNRARIIIDEGAKVHGHIYAQGFAEIKGIVHGMVWCDKFYLTQAAEPNYLLDAVIDLKKMSTNFAGSGIVASGKKKKVIKWLQ